MGLNITSFRYHIMASHDEHLHILKWHGPFQGQLAIYDGPSPLSKIVFDIRNTSSSIGYLDKMCWILLLLTPSSKCIDNR